jgi:hypothetical protein
MRIPSIVLLCALIGCRAGEIDPDDKTGTTADATTAQGEDSASPWYEYDEDGGGSGSGDGGGDDEGKEDGTGDEGKEDGTDDYEYEACPDDFNPNEPCDVPWEEGGICIEGDTLWYCDAGTWTDK